MENWITTHFPHPKNRDHPWHIYLQEEFVKPGMIGTKIKDGDGVLFYELAMNPLQNEQPAFEGFQGIVVSAIVDGILTKRPSNVAEDEKSNGKPVSYKWELRTRDEDRTGFVAKEDVLTILGFKPKFKWMGFGGGSGVKELKEEQYRDLLDLFQKGQAVRCKLEQGRARH